jgi:hypothetical protein
MMISISQKQVLSFLDQGWGTYVQRFQSLSPSEQAAFLRKQGFAHLADLLGHVIAWWEESIPAVQSLLANPDFQPPNYDVDVFNARAVARFRTFSEAEVIQAFESTRVSLRALVASLPEEAFQNVNLARRLHIEVIGHLKDHDLE